MTKYISSFIFLFFLISAFVSCDFRKLPDMPSENLNIDKLLMQHLKPDTPLGSSGRIVRAESHWNWGFGPAVWLKNDGPINLLPVKIMSKGMPVTVKGGIYYPSHSILEGERDSVKTNIACNPFFRGFPAPIASFTSGNSMNWGPIDGNPGLSNLWSNKGSINGEDWYGVDFGTSQLVHGVLLELASGYEKENYTQPASFRLEYFASGAWIEVPFQQYFPAAPSAGKNWIRFPRLRMQKLRVVFIKKDRNDYLGLINFLVQGPEQSLPDILEKKFISEDDVLVSLLTISNPSWHFSLDINLLVGVEWARQIEDNQATGKMSFKEDNYFIIAGGSELKDEGGQKFSAQFLLAPREAKTFRLIAAIGQDEQIVRKNYEKWAEIIRPLRKQKIACSEWFRTQIPHFTCPDWTIIENYYRYWQNVKHSLPSGLALLEQPMNISVNSAFNQTQSQNLMREFCWIRDPEIQALLRKRGEAIDEFTQEQINADGNLTGNYKCQNLTEFIYFLLELSHNSEYRKFNQEDFRVLIDNYLKNNTDKPHQIRLSDSTNYQRDVLFSSAFFSTREQLANFADILIRSIPGVTYSENAGMLKLFPLVTDDFWEYFILENVPYQKHLLTFIWDNPDSVDHFNDFRNGFDIYIDGKLAKHTPHLHAADLALD